MSKEIKIVKDEQRKSRGLQQKIFLILTHKYDDDILERAYEVMGTTGNVYTVTINKSPTCTCPDYMTRAKRCKHIYFVLTRIMKVKPEQEDIEKYSNADLCNMFESIPQITESLRVDAAKLSKFKELKKNKNGEVKMREITEEDMCPICLTELDDPDDLIYCKYSCGYNLHKQCFDMYNTKRTEIKCLFCQQDWNPENHYIKL
jgi:hypothetical protein